MASGNVTGYQHMLIDEENLTKEKFIELCDKWFYHLDHYDMKSQEELEIRRKKEIEKYTIEIQKNQEELTAMRLKSNDELQKDYITYVNNSIEANKVYLEKFNKETERFKLVCEYAKSITPHLNYVWKDLKEPSLFQIEIESFPGWKESIIRSYESSVKFYTDLKQKAGARDSSATEEGRITKDYEEKKKKFLTGE